MIEGQDEPRCFECGYSLRGLESGRCPECGRAVDAPPIPIPWKLRGQIGWVQAYWKTAWAMTFGWKWIWRDYERPADVRGARLFAGLTAVWAWLPAAVCCGQAYAQWNWADFARQGYCQVISLMVGMLAFLWYMAGAPAALCRWPRRDKSEEAALAKARGTALALYACGPLAFIGILGWMVSLSEVVMPKGLGLVSYITLHEAGSGWLAALLGVVALGLLIRWYVTAVKAIELAAASGKAGAVASAAWLVVLWAGLAVIYLGMFVTLVYASLMLFT